MNASRNTFEAPRLGLSVFAIFATLLLSILALCGVAPKLLLSISVICFGVAFVFKSNQLHAHFTAFLSKANTGSLDFSNIGNVVSPMSLAGITGIVLGVLSLAHVLGGLLISIAILVFGAGIVLSNNVVARMLQTQICESGADDRVQHVALECVNSSRGFISLAGLAGIVLGILCVIQVAPLTLSLIAILVMSGAALVVNMPISSMYGRLFGSTH